MASYPYSVRHKLASLISLLALLINLLPPLVQPVRAAELPPLAENVHMRPRPVIVSHSQPVTPVGAKADALLPGWFKPSTAPDLAAAAGLNLARPAFLPAAEAQGSRGGGGPAIAAPAAVGGQPSAAVLPTWFNSSPPNSSFIPAKRPSSFILPTWFDSSLPNSSFRLPPSSLYALPPLRPMANPIPGVEVNVFAPASVSVGNFMGDTYTITIRNNSGLTGFNFFITATIPFSGFIYAPGSAQLVSSVGGVITVTEGYTDPLVVWTPNITRNLIAGEVVTLTFRLTTDGSAVSGQRLDANAVYENPLGSPGRSNGGANITVGRGNLIISKSPTVRPADFGDRLAWTIEVANTGLGMVYSTTLDDLFGAGYTNIDTSALAVTPFHLTVGERRSFVVTATVNACGNLTDTALTWWSIGNSEGDGLVTNPASDTVDVIFNLEIPNISLSANSVSFDYCTQTPRTIVITVTNTGDGPATNFVLTSTNLAGLPFTVSNVISGWNYNGAGVFTTANPIMGGAVVTLAFDITPNSTVCGSGAGNINFVSSYGDACGLSFRGPSTSASYNYSAGVDAPNVNLTKNAALSGSQVLFTVNFLAQNSQSFSGNLVITDIVPAGLNIDSFSSGGVGTITPTGNTLIWTIVPPPAGDQAGTLHITTTRTGDPNICNSYNNLVTATVAVTCPQCNTPIVRTASGPVGPNPLTPTITYTVNSLQFDYCSLAAQTVTVVITNTGDGPASNFGLDFSQVSPGELPDVQPYPGSVDPTYGFTVTLGPPNSGWAYIPSGSQTGAFSYTANSGVISAGHTITLTFVVTPYRSVCGNAGEWRANLEPSYTDICGADLTGPAGQITSTLVETNTPRFGVAKSSNAPTPLTVGSEFDFIVDFTALNAQNMNASARFTDIVPPAFTVLSYTGTAWIFTDTEIVIPGSFTYALTGTNVTPAGLVTSTIITSPVASATQMVWNVPINSVAAAFTLTGRLTIHVQVLDLTALCGANSQYINTVTGTVGNACPTCPPMTATARAIVGIEPPTGPPAAGGSSIDVTDQQVCGLVQLTNIYSRVFVSDWNRVTFTDTLGTDFGLPVGALSYQTGTLRVIIDGTDVTTWVNIVQTSPRLLLDFDQIVPTVTVGTRNITITYSLYLSSALVSSNPTFNAQTRTLFEVQNVAGSGPCGTGDNYLFDQPASFTVRRADLQIDISPDAFAACALTPVTLTVSDPNLIADALVANNIVVTFSVGSPDFDSISGYTYGGGFAGNPVAITTGTDVITWQFQYPLTQTGATTGTINFELTRGCGAQTLQAGVSFADNCGVSFSDDAANSAAVTPPDVRLFVTPDTYVVNENRAIWRIYAINVGDGVASRVLITDVLGLGLRFVTYTTNYSSQVGLLPPLPAVGGDDIAWELLNLQPGQLIRLDVTADVVACGGLTSDISMTAGCDSCPSTAADSLVFLLPPVAVRTSNAQTADLPFCDVGEITLVVKNSSATAHIYQMIITQTLLSGLEYISGSTRFTVTDRFGAVISGLANIPFEPVTATAGIADTVMRWSLSNPGLTLTQTQILTDRAPEDTITVTFRVQTNCDLNDSVVVRSQAAGLYPCGNFFSSSENSDTIPKERPDLALTKQGRNLTQGGPTAPFTDPIYGQPGDVIQWRVEAVNTIGAYRAQNVIVTDVVPAELVISNVIVSVSAGTVVSAGQVITWTIGELPADGVNRVMTITTLITNDIICTLPSTNTALLNYGCTNCIQYVGPASATLIKRADLSLQLPPSTNLNICGGDLNITIRNLNGPTAYSVTLTDTLPSGYEYVSSAIGGASPAAIISPTAGATVLTWTWNVISRGDTLITVTIRQITGTGYTCVLTPTASNRVELSYENNDNCVDPARRVASDTAAINFQVPNLTIAKLPSFQVADVGHVVTWTIRVTNTGSGVAQGVVVTDVAYSQFISLTEVSNSSGATTTQATNAITWYVGNIAANNGTWSAVVTAVLLAAGENNNEVGVTAICNSGCQTSRANNVAYVSLLNQFVKTSRIPTGTIGSLVVFDLRSTLSDRDGDYRNIVVSDVLPLGLGFVSAVLTYTYDQDLGGTTEISYTPTLTPGLYNSGNVVWNLGNLPGTIELEGVITAVIQDNPVNTNGISRTNQFRLTYEQDGAPYLFTSTIPITIEEPLLHLGKSYVTESGCPAELLTYNFNNLSSSGWSALGTWTVTPEGYYQNTSNTTNHRAFIGTSAWTDYSFSFMMRTSDPTGSMGGYVRQNNTGTLDTGYLFRWSNTQMQLELRSAGTVLTTTAGGYQINRWYHVEIRVTGNLIEVFVDGVRRLSATNSNFVNGRVGLLSSSHTQTQFDDILVTRLGQSGCTVGANDLVTYTVTISNQSKLPGYDLVITDAIPPGMSLVTYSLTSNDPTNPAVTAEPAPIPGATGLLIWNVDHLTPSVPFNPLAHTALTLTVVLQVATGITANTVLANQASLTYDNWSGNTSPTTITRNYSGGSHSTAVRTVNGGIRKALLPIEPPPTATLGTLVTYTLIVPVDPITATLYDVIVTDTLNPPRFYIEEVTVSGGTGASTNFNQSTGLITAAFASIPHGDQGRITITARISHEFPPLPADDPDRGDVITNAAVMTHSAATALTRTNEVSVTVREPLLAISKAGAVVAGDPQAVDYTVRVTNLGDAVAYGPLFIQDYIPAGVTITNISNGGQLLSDNRTISWTLASLANGVFVEFTYRLQLTEPIYASSLFTNTAVVTNTSLTSTIPGVRPYVTDTVYTFPWPLGRVGDYVWVDVNYDGRQDATDRPISNVVVALYNSVTGQLVVTTTTSITGYYIFEHLPLGLTYTVQLSPSNFESGGPLVPYQPTRLREGSPDRDSNTDENAFFNGSGYAVTTTVLANSSVATADLTLDFGFVPRMSLGNQLWFDVNDDGRLTPGEPPISDVVVELYRGGTLISTTTTTTGGYYTFTNLLPTFYPTESYRVVITAPNFNSGGPLYGYLTSTLAVTSNNNIARDEVNHGYLSGMPGSGGFVASTLITLTVDQQPHDAAGNPSPNNNHNFTIDFGFLRPDLGDLPDSYGTSLAQNGPRHVISPTNNPILGSRVDAESDGQPSGDARGDDDNATTGTPNNGDDEDGVEWTTLILGQTSAFTITALVTNAYLNGWIDWNGNGQFDATEQVITSLQLTNPTTVLPVFVPPTATITGNVGLRFRYSTSPTLAAVGLAPTGQMPNGEVEDYLTTTVAYDFGDLPDGYGTLLTSNGPSHRILPVGNPTLGGRVDAEGTGQPGPTALGDDANDTSGVGTPGPDDEDGVEFSMTSLVPGETLVITVSASISSGVLNAWLDLNADGDFNDAGEQIALDEPIAAGGSAIITVPIPDDIPQNVTTYARFRFSSAGGLTPTGPAPDGEVEDYALPVRELDYGDLPNDGLAVAGYVTGTYPTTYTQNGPRHVILPTGNPTLGSRVDAETDGQPTLLANGDDTNPIGLPDDEDGVVFSGPLVPGDTVIITVTAAAGGADGYLNAWLDLNTDGVLDVGDQIALNRLITAGGFITLTVNVPLTATQGLTTYSRFRFSSQQDLSPTGLAGDGEIEDHPIPIAPLDWGDLPDRDYPTLSASNGPRHIIDGTYLGRRVDAEINGQPSITATGDDLTASTLGAGTLPGDDEDGIVFLTPIVRDRPAQIQVTAGTAGYLNAWFDFDGDGSPDDFTITDINGTGVISQSDGDIFLGTPGGFYTLTFTVPDVPISSSLYSRFRYTTNPNEANTPEGLAPTGEVEDYVLLSLGDLVWLDDGANGGVRNDGQYQVGQEAPLSNVVLVLLDGSGNVITDASGNPITVTTGANGRYLFTGLTPGDYRVEVLSSNFATGGPLAGLLSSSGAGAPDDDFDEATDENGLDDAAPESNGIRSQNLTLTLGGEPTNDGDSDTNSNLTLDFGFVPQLNLGNQVWFDVDDNGTLDGGEPYFDGVDVELYRDTDGDGQFTPGVDQYLSTTTTINGYYTFTNLAQGGYVVVITSTNFDTGGALAGYLTSTRAVTGNSDLNEENHGTLTGVPGSGGYVASTVVTLTAGLEPDDAGRSNYTIDFGFVRYDLGDLPDDGAGVPGYALQTYPTRLGDDGPRHVILPDNNPTLGDQVDAEVDGQPNTPATGDDDADSANVYPDSVSPADDEDGVTLPAVLIPGELLTLTVRALSLASGGADGRLTAWIDFDGDGQLELAERIVTGQLITAGAVVDIPFVVPLTTQQGITTYARFRFGAATETITQPTGLALAGEVEDYAIPTMMLDWGDLPDSPYPTLSASNGPRHIIDGTYLGNRVDAEINGQSSITATGDDLTASTLGAGADVTTAPDDEDGLVFLTPIVRDRPAQIQVTAGTAGYLNAWFDFDGNGSPDAFTITDINGTGVISQSDGDIFLETPGGVYTLTLTVPDVPISSSLYSRFRYTTNPNEANTPEGLAPTGEVEDYVLLSLGDLVWLDDGPGAAYNNGQYQPLAGETPINNVILGLLDSSGNVINDANGNPITAATDINGRYLFTGLIPGDYRVEVLSSNFATGAPLAGLLSSSGAGAPNDDLDEAVDENGLDDANPQTNGIRSQNLSLALGAEPPYPTRTDGDSDTNSNLTLDFGFVPLMNLGNQVWFDVDDSGALDSGEPPIDGVDVELYRDADGDGQFTPGVDQYLSTTTTVNGYYTFTNLAQGGYVVVITSSNFNTGGALAGYLTSTRAVAGNSDLNEENHGYLTGVPGSGGYVASTVVTLTAGLEPDDAGRSNYTIDFGFVRYDLADLPDGYQTTLANDGPRHVILPVDNPYLGSIVDAEPDGQPSPNANGDDNTNSTNVFPGGATPGDDEDGVQLNSLLVPGQIATFTITAANVTGARLSAWIDWNGDGDFDDAAEQVFDREALSDGANELVVTAPNIVLSQTINTRWRYSTDESANHPTGAALNGEVEDHQYSTIVYDLGDLPDTSLVQPSGYASHTYPTRLSDDGPRHVILPNNNPTLGGRVDAELDGQPSTSATGDDDVDSLVGIGTLPNDDEDGVTFSGPLVPGEILTITVTTLAAANGGADGRLTAWIDFNGNGQLEDSERIILGQLIVAGDSLVLPVPVPLTATPNITTYARFRFSGVTETVTLPTGLASAGEVEDYAIPTLMLDWGDLPDTTGPYNTTIASDGPRHIIDGTYLGRRVDAESDGQDNPAANGDDANDSNLGAGTGLPADDEDGILFLTPIIRGREAQIQVTAGTTGYLNAWFDFEGDGALDIFNITAMTGPGGSSTGNSNTDIFFDTPGVYTLTFTAPDVPISSSLYSRFRYTTNANEANAPDGLASTGEVEDYVLLSLGDLVWRDIGAGGNTNNGIFDSDEAGVANVTLQLRDPLGGGQPVLDGAGNLITTSTDANGRYLFTGLTPGDYRVEVISSNFTTGGPLAELLSSSGVGAPNDDLDETDDENGLDDASPETNGIRSDTIVLTIGGEPQGNGNANLTLDFGFTPRMSLGNRVWFDANDDGFRAGTEPVIPNVVVELYRDSNGDGLYTPGTDQIISTTLTNLGGYYTFTNLLPSRFPTESYLVVITSTNFTTGPLVDHVPSSVTRPSSNAIGDDDWNHGDVNGPLGTPGGYVASTPILLTINQQPHDADGNPNPTNSGNHNYTIDFGFLQADLGDLPDVYGTLLGNNGPRHVISPTNNPTLGSRVDAESDGQPSGGANGDDLTGSTPDDEDGVAWSDLVVGQTSAFTITALNGGGYLNGWVDFNSDGDFDDAGEQIFSVTPLNAGDNFFPVFVPTATTVITTGPIYMRFRYSTSPTLSYTGPAPDGEVEDYVTNLRAYDLGDLPEQSGVYFYGTTLANNGPRHLILPAGNPTLGRRVDAEGDGQPSLGANGDDANPTSGIGDAIPDDEDGVEFSTTVVAPGSTLIITVSASIAAGLLNGWLDLNADGDFDDAGEQIALDASINAGGFINLAVPIPLTVPQSANLYARFRFSSQSGLSTTGDAADGEVEDYLLPTGLLDWGDLPDGPYATLYGSNGPRHRIDGTFLGSRVDAEGNGQPNNRANGDDVVNSPAGAGALPGDDEDGVIFLTPLMRGREAQIQVTAGTAGYLNAWFDFEGDGVFDNFNITNVAGPVAVTPGSSDNDIFLSQVGVYTLTFTVPDVVISNSLYSRFRFTTNSGEANTPDGLALTGEVEDYVLLSLGDRVWIDDGAGGGGFNNGRLDGSEVGRSGVTLELRDSSGNPVLDGGGNPVTTTTDDDGRYLFTGLTPGDYSVFIPSSNFNGPGGQLVGYVSSSGSGSPDDNDDETVDENGLDNPVPESNGIASNNISLSTGDEPQGNGNSNLTLDFGLVPLAPYFEFNKRVSPTGTISPGQQLDYTICYTNGGIVTATNVVITDFVPFNTTYITGSASLPVEYTVDGVVWTGIEPLPAISVTGLRWTIPAVGVGGNGCVNFAVQVNLTIVDPASGLTVQYTPLGWAVLEGDVSDVEVLTYTTLSTPTVTATPETTVTPTAEVTPTPGITLTVTPTPPLLPPTPGVTPLPTLEATATPVATVEASPTPAPPATETPTVEPTPTLPPPATVTPTAEPVDTSTPEPAAPPTVEAMPTEPPTPEATIEPTEESTTTALFQPAPVIPARLVIANSRLPHPSSFTLHPSSFIPHPSSFLLHPFAQITSTETPPVEPMPTELPPAFEPTSTELPPATEPAATELPPTLEPTEAAPVTTEPTIVDPVEATATATAEPGLEPTATAVNPEPVTPTPDLTPTAAPEIVPTEPATPTAALGYPIVGFETVEVNVVNGAVIGSDQTVTQTDVVTTPVIRIVDPILVKGADPSQARPGERVNYFIRVENPQPPSNANATNIVVVDAMPPELTYLDYSFSASPGVQVDVTVTSGLMRLVGHPLGITETVVYTITMEIPVLGPGQTVQLNIVAQVNNVANPPPRTIQNLAIMTFNEGSPRRDNTPVDVPLPPRPPRDDDDDDEVPAPSPTPIPPAAPLPQATPAPTLPALFLPETGLLGSRTGGGGLGGWLLLVIVLGGLGMVVGWPKLRLKIHRRNRP